MNINNPTGNYPLTLSQQTNVMDIIDTTINCLDEAGLNELLTSYQGDVEKLFRDLYVEATDVLNFSNGKIKSSTFDYLDHFSRATEESFRIESLAYFIDSVLTDFILGTFHIEWAQLVQLYQYLGILAARDHCFAKDTNIRMYDGSIKAIQDIVSGDKVMGYDLKPRNVLKTHNGFIDMYRIHHSDKSYYDVNKNHLVYYEKDGKRKIDSVSNLHLRNIHYKKKSFGVKVDYKTGEEFKPYILTEKLDKDEYFGFECDGDHLFLLEDGTVVHNSKSYFFSYAYILWNLYRYKKYDPLTDRNRARERSGDGMLITNEIKLASDLLEKIKTEIEENPELNPLLMPHSKNEGWSKESIRCKNGAKWVVKSSGSKIRGTHPKTVIVDDFLNDQVLYSKSQSQKLIDFFRSVIMNAAIPSASVTVVGTPFTNRDLYAELKKSSQWRVFEYPAIYPDGSLLFPERHTFEKLMAKKQEQGSVIFSREILVRPISDDSAIFTSDIIKEMYRDTESHRLVSNRLGVDPKKFKRVVMGCDFAISANTGADYTCFITVGVDFEDKVWILNVFRQKGITFAMQKQTIERLYNAFKHDLIMMETNGFQAIYKQEADAKGLPVVDHKTHRYNKKSVYEGLPGMAAFAEIGKLKLASGDTLSRETSQKIASELMSIMYDPEKGKMESVSENDDSVMALWIALQCAKNAHTQVKFSFI